MNRKHEGDPNSGKSTVRQALGVATAGTLAALAVLASANKHNGGGETDHGQPRQRNPKQAVEHVGRAMVASAQGGGYHTLPYYESGTGPDGRIDYYSYKFTQDGPVPGYHSNRIDGGTPAPAADGPANNHSNQHLNPPVQP